ncbi:enoyl-CoA hydratase-related protein [Metallumcola ferriviriculae]|uniref:Enoyl-CoA hydratase-related protein n=1 Tax=Metallumcola ferriviriculae TaxID=3039180 RepID=A0AAU0UND2_9FIRM|nr:enoyl-CoA hydratase-related protein [Desulfitibacteraceae bacterium MK1]
MESIVLIERSNSVTYISLNQPNNYNALNPEMAEKLSEAISKCFEDKSRAVVIRGIGKAFCSGGDLSYLNSQDSISQALAGLTQLFHRLITDIRLLPKPVIAAVNGAAAGGGMSLALACDLRIASDKAKFKQAYTSGGLVPDGGWSLFAPAMLGYSKASELLLLDEVIDAQRAYELGLVNLMVPSSEFNQKVEEVATNLAKGATIAHATAKELLNQSIMPMLETHLEKERQAMISIGQTEDIKEGLISFLAKRAPSFSGK